MRRGLEEVDSEVDPDTCIRLSTDHRDCRHRRGGASDNSVNDKRVQIASLLVKDAKYRCVVRLNFLWL